MKMMAELDRGGNPRDKTRERLEAIEPLLHLLEIPLADRFPHLFGDGQRAETWSDAIKWCATRSDRSARQIYRILALFKRGGKDALSQKTRSDKGLSRFFAAHPKTAFFVAYLHLAWKLNAASIRAALIRNEAMFGTVPSDETIRLFLKITPMPLLIKLALQGQLAYRRVAADFFRDRSLAKGKDVFRKIA